jgi:hypothetical protein
MLQVLLKANCARFVQIHTLIHKMAANRNEDGTLKSLSFGGSTRGRVSSQARKSMMRYCEDPELGLRLIKLPSGKNGEHVAVSHPSRGHFERVLAALPKDGTDDRTRSQIVKAVYDTVVGTKGAETKANDKRQEAESRLTKAKETFTEVENEVAAATDAKVKRDLDKKLKKAEQAVERAQLALHQAGGDVELDEAQAQAAATKAEAGTDQVMILSDHEIDLLIELTKQSLKALASGDEKSHHKVVKDVVRVWKAEHGDEFRSMQLGCGVESAVFGRPVYGGGLFQQAPSAVGASHEIGVHEQRIGYDTFTAIDEYKKDAGEMGAGMLGELPLSKVLLYGYMFIDTWQLIENIERSHKDSAIAGEVIRRLILMASRLSSKTKQGSLASKNHSLLTLVEVGDEQPATMEDAFIEAVKIDHDRPNMLVNTFDRLGSFIESADGAHPSTNKRAMAIVDATGKSSLRGVVTTVLDDLSLADWAVRTANHESVPAAVERPAAKNGGGSSKPTSATAE